MSKPIRASGVAPERIEWLWRHRVPRGMITTVAGRPDQGKGLFATHLAAEVSAAGGNVLYSAAEDSHGLMTRPRLEAAGADLDRVLLWRFQLPRDFEEVCEIVREESIDLIVMDPLGAHLMGGVNRFGDSIRRILNPMTKLIETHNASLVIIEHALKNPPKSGHPLDAIGGSSSGLPAASRAVFVLGKDPDDDDRRVLAPAKFNIGTLPKAFAFELDVEDIDVVGEVPFLIADDELVAFDPMKLFAHPQPGGKVGRPDSKRAAACEWLTTYLADAGKPVKSGVIQEDAKQYGMSPKTLRRAADDMEIVRNPPGGGRNCTWDLPEDVKEMMGLLEEAPASAPATDGDVDDIVAGFEGLLADDGEDA